jgi:hypothetical protein
MASLINSAGATGTGSMTVQGPNTNSNQVLTIPDATGTVMVTGNMPAFRYYASTGTTISAGATTKLTFDTKDYDTNNNFASSRFTPTVAGYYQISIGVRPTTSASTETAVYLYKNSSNNQIFYDVITSVYDISGSTLVYMNGSTDYIEIYMYAQTAGTTPTGSTGVWFSGVLVRSA